MSAHDTTTAAGANCHRSFAFRRAGGWPYATSLSTSDTPEGQAWRPRDALRPSMSTKPCRPPPTPEAAAFGGADRGGHADRAPLRGVALGPGVLPTGGIGRRGEFRSPRRLPRSGAGRCPTGWPFHATRGCPKSARSGYVKQVANGSNHHSATAKRRRRSYERPSPEKTDRQAHTASVNASAIFGTALFRSAPGSPPSRARSYGVSSRLTITSWAPRSTATRHSDAAGSTRSELPITNNNGDAETIATACPHHHRIERLAEEHRREFKKCRHTPRQPRIGVTDGDPFPGFVGGRTVTATPYTTVSCMVSVQLDDLAGGDAGALVQAVDVLRQHTHGDAPGRERR